MNLILSALGDMLTSKNKIISSIPSWYDWRVHILVPWILGLGIIGLCGSLLSNLGWVDLLIGILFLFCMFGFEWFIHRYILHGLFPGGRYLLRMHSIHHSMYKQDSMAYDSRLEMYHILVPIYAILFVFIGLLPFAGLISLISWNAGLLAMMIGVGFFLAYEFLHLAYHSPAGNWNRRLVDKLGLAKLHDSHHAVENMKKYNFNVTLPIFDRIMGTYK